MNCAFYSHAWKESNNLKEIVELTKNIHGALEYLRSPCIRCESDCFPELNMN